MEGEARIADNGGVAACSGEQASLRELAHSAIAATRLFGEGFEYAEGSNLNSYGSCCLMGEPCARSLTVAAISTVDIPFGQSTSAQSPKENVKSRFTPALDAGAGDGDRS